MINAKDNKTISILRIDNGEFLLTARDNGDVAIQIVLTEYDLLKIMDCIIGHLAIKHANDDIDGR